MKKTVGQLLILLAISIGLPSAVLQAQSINAPGIRTLQSSARSMPTGKDSALQERWNLLQRIIMMDHSKRTLDLLDSLATVARKDGRRDYLLKAAIFRLIYQRSSTDGAVTEGIPYLDSLIGSSKEPDETSILLVTKARLLFSIYQKDKYKIDGRTDIQNSARDETHMDSWTKADFYGQIHALYQKALAPAKVLQNTPNKDYNALVTPSTPGFLRPTLYDLIVSDALDLWNSYQITPGSSEQSFVLDDPMLLSARDSFVNARFVLPDPGDSLHPKWLSVQLYQQLLRFHLSATGGHTARATLGDLDMQRLQWVYENAPATFIPGHLTKGTGAPHGTNPLKETLYRDALKKAIDLYQGTDASLFGGYLLAATYQNSAAAYDPSRGLNTDTTHRYDRVKALQIINSFQGPLNKAVAAATDSKNKYQVSEGAAMLLNLKNQILQPDYKLQVAAYNIPGEPMLARLEFRNTQKLYGRILRVPAWQDNLNYTDSLWRQLISQTPVKTFTQRLPNTGDYQTHATEIMLPQLEKGYYILLTSRSPDFKLDSGLAAIDFGVTSLAYIIHGSDQFFLDRKTGAPLPLVQLSLFQRSWNGHGYTNILDTTLTADNKGHVSYPQDYHNLALRATLAGDTLKDVLSVFEPYHDVSYEQDENGLDIEGQKDLIFYLDRSIYRPGQQVQFKAVATFIYQDARGRKLWTDKKEHLVYLNDANGETIDSLRLHLNDFGAFDAAFTLPSGHLPGTYSIFCDDLGGEQSFRVEDYKRPTYFVQLDTLKAAMAIGDSVTIQGQVMAYSGYPITQAKVEIAVTRSVYFPYRWYGYLPSAHADVISHGQVTTDEKGNFSFRFKAVKGEASWLKYLPDYRFDIDVTSTDPSGETRTAKQQLTIGSQPFNMELQVAENWSGDGSGSLLDTIGLATRTAGGQFTAQKVKLTLTRLTAPQRLLRERPWQAPDLSVMDSATFVRLFAHDPYLQENDKANWKRAQVVYTRQVTTTRDAKVAIHQRFEPGWYELTAEAPGNNGFVIRDQQYIYLFNGSDPLIAPAYNWSASGAVRVLPGEKTGLQIASSVKDQYFVYTVSRMQAEDASMADVYVGDSLLKGPLMELPVRLTSKDVYGQQLDYSFIRDNRTYSGKMTVQLKDTTTQPVIVYESYRDKTEPGSEEHWTIRINKGTQPQNQMELLSAMYDASLDQFSSHSWRLPAKGGSGRLAAANWQSGNSFGNSYPRAYRAYIPGYSSGKSYGYLAIKDWFSQLNNSGRRIMIRGISTMAGVKVTGSADSQFADMAAPESKALSGVVAGYIKEKIENLTAGVNIVVEGPQATQPVRSDFRETAFFFPHIHSDAKGNYNLTFQMPDALTTWKWMNLAYDKELNVVQDVRMIVSQKTLMVSPNLPRFVRNGDQWTLPVKVVNLSGQKINTEVTIELTDPATGKALNWVLGNAATSRQVSVNAGSNQMVYFELHTPEDFTGPAALTVKASGGQYSDAEKNLIPVITNKIQLTETLPVYMDSDGTRHFTLEKLLKEGAHKDNQKLVFELTTNPIWQVVLALPELRVTEHAGAEDLMGGLYAEAMGQYVMKTYPRIKEVIKGWASDTLTDKNNNALSSQLDKNPDLKSVLLEQTPWVLEAKGESQQRAALVRFFEDKKEDSLQRALVNRLLGLQQPDGGFAWFSGGKSNVLTTQRVLLGIKELTGGKIKDQSLALPLQVIEQNATRYLAAYYQMRYQQWEDWLREEKIRRSSHKEALDNLDTVYPVTGMEIQYLYALSLGGSQDNKAALERPELQFLAAEKHHWEDKSVYLKLLMAATQYRTGDRGFALDSLLSSAMNSTVTSPDLGRYWKQPVSYYNWYENPLQSVAMAIRLISEVKDSPEGYGKHPEFKDYLPGMQRYMISQKQVNRWPALQTTVDACLAMIAAAPGNLDSKRTVEVQLGSKKLDLKAEPATGYMRYEVSAKQITPDMGNLTLQIKGMGEKSGVPVYGGLYWQYLSAIKDVSAAENKTGIALEKALYREINTSNGKQLVAVKTTDRLQVGDKLVSRLIIQTDRDMDYIHLREMRAAGVQPDQNISGYQYQDGISFYQAISDLTTDLYFDHLSKGTHVIEYPVHISHAGSFAAGTALIESFYAPEFATHTEGVQLEVKQTDR